TRFWTDNWSPYGCLEDFLQLTISRRMGIPATATLQEISLNGNWNIQSPRNDNQVLVQTYLSTLVLTDTEDSYTWTVDGVVWDKYKTGVIYGLLKLHSQLVSWHGIVWTNGGIPKHNFLVWLFTLNRYTITTLQNIRLPKPHKKLLLIAWQCSIYLLWSERNSRIHRNGYKSPQLLLSSLDLIVRNRCSSFREQNPQLSSSMLQLWFR
ncbi:unnamed protein product, partial [Brassica rapa subsp. trilocularis]